MKYGTFLTVNNPANSKDIHLKGGNLYLKGFGVDTNGNSIIKLTYPNGSGFSIQLHNLPDVKRLFTRHIHDDLNQYDLDIISDSVISYIQQYGSAKQKKGLHLYKTNPYKSKAQQRKFHAMLERGEIDAGTVKEFDEASRGKKLPERINPEVYLVSFFVDNQTKPRTKDFLTEKQAKEFIKELRASARQYGYTLKKVTTTRIAK